MIIFTHTKRHLLSVALSPGIYHLFDGVEQSRIHKKPGIPLHRCCIPYSASLRHRRSPTDMAVTLLHVINVQRSTSKGGFPDLQEYKWKPKYLSNSATARDSQSRVPLKEMCVVTDLDWWIGEKSSSIKTGWVSCFSPVYSSPVYSIVHILDQFSGQRHSSQCKIRIRGA